MFSVKCHFLSHKSCQHHPWEIPHGISSPPAPSGSHNSLGRLHFSMELTESHQASADEAEAEDASGQLSLICAAHGFCETHGKPYRMLTFFFHCGYII